MTGFVERPEILNPAVTLNSADFARTLHGHVLPEGADWRLAMEPEYWRLVADRLREGDRIECLTYDRQITFEIVILAVNPRVTPIHLEIGVRPIWPLDQPVPAAVRRDRLPYRVQATAGGRFDIVNSRNEVVRANLSRIDALDLTHSMIEAERDAAPKASPPARAAR